MRSCLFTVALLASIMSSSARADGPPSRSERIIFATVGWSEWCPPGQVIVDFYSGYYRWVVQNPRRICQTATTTELREGKLDLAQLVAVQKATETVLKDGINRPECTSGINPSNPVISNAAGPYFLVISSKVGSLSAAGDLGCWSDASVGLQRLLQRIFDRQAMKIKEPS